MKRKTLCACLMTLCLLCACGRQAVKQPEASVEETDRMSEDEKKIQDIIAGMTLKQKVAQVILIGITARTSSEDIEKWQPGGVLLFADSFEKSTPAKMKKRLARFQKNVQVPLFTAVDEEGGIVTRISRFKAFRKRKFASPRDVYKRGGFKAIVSDTKEKDKLLLSLGVNTNLAPVADVAYKKSNFIYSRSVSTDVKKAVTFIQKVVDQMNEDQVVSCLKHFPGYGNNGDTHTDIITDKRARETFTSRDLLPFIAGIERNCGMVMVSHNIVTAFDESQPASISPTMMTYLRDELHYEGVIVTDSVSMKGVSRFAGSSPQAAVKALVAGADLVCADRGFTDLSQAILKAVKDGTLSEERLNASLMRLLKLKMRMGMLS